MTPPEHANKLVMRLAGQLNTKFKLRRIEKAKKRKREEDA